MRPKIAIKRYPHFDSLISLEAAQDLITSPTRVAQHAFYPFLEYEKRWTKYAKKGKPGKEKCRLIRYAARRDACIHAHYRSILAERYEAKLEGAGLSECVIGYRRVPIAGSPSNKCNIHFAQDSFRRIKSMGACHVYALDISKFFEHIDDAILREKWAQLLGLQLLPPDHYRVYLSVTKYACVNKLAAFEALGFIGKPVAPSKQPKAYLTKHDNLPIQLCDPKKFRDIIAPLITVNESGCGVPQGAAISDVLSNLYLFDFDTAMNQWATKHGGFYVRYSDDILIATSGNVDRWSECLATVREVIKLSGNQLEIQPSKCSAYRVTQKQSARVEQEFSLIHSTGCKNGIEYLGFRFDGVNIYLRESTRSKLNRSIVRACRRVARSHVFFNPGLSFPEVLKTVRAKRVYKEIGRVEEFETKAKSYKKWTFWTYAKRCGAILGNDGKPIFVQLAGYRKFVRLKLEQELRKAYKNPSP